ncbi:hypothetical protein [Actimicrobium sp. CCI2.3]|uniref:hypothetical protein n=1 Tax=Actimicrobium sp. CCI2.3 TaxID=3048616 RepID=UPI002AB3AD19|nr:hypothetical protein [Actimicrobium sp. CCI2.3]MDY7575923.1 hypothetical protein [Actimicrobium sp. CCI2.3]MEB0023191.1 hypothetical protein [Actimicrobium sp. CCI2.3]
MFSTITRLPPPTLCQPPNQHSLGDKINRLVASGYARALQQFATPSSLPGRSSPSQKTARRGIVSQAILESLQSMPATKAASSSFAFNREHLALTDTCNLQRAVVTKLAPEATTQPALVVHHNPAVNDIEALVAKHGPVSLSLLGMLAAHEGGSALPRSHTVLVLHTFRDEHGCCFAVVVDGNPHARNAFKDAAEETAQRIGKQLHELGQPELAAVERKLALRGERMGREEAIHDLINLDRAFETHEATTTSYRNFLGTLGKDLEKEGLLDNDFNMNSLPTAQATYARNVRIDGALPGEIANALREQIKRRPDYVKPFIPLQSPVAPPDLFEQIPAVRDVFNAPSVAGRWSPPATTEELKNALRQESTFAAAVDAPENQARLDMLHKAITNTVLPPNHRGVSLQLQFPVTYGHVAHIAPLNLWREAGPDGTSGKLQMGCLYQDARLQMGLLHQEATPISGKVWEGEVHPTFDTSAVYPGGVAPIAESLKFTGLPNVTTVLPCKYPDKIVPLTRAMAGRDNAYPYGGTPLWHGDKGRFPPERPFNSCSNTSYEVHMICNGQYPTYQSTLPELWRGKIGELYNVDQRKIQTCRVGDKEYNVEDMLHLPFDIVGAMWPKVTVHSATLPSAVPCTYAPEHPAPTPLEVGDNLRLPDAVFPARFHAARFINPVKDMRLADGTPIKNGITYFADTLRQGIFYSNNKAGKKLDFWLSGIATSSQTDGSRHDLTGDKGAVV